MVVKANNLTIIDTQKGISMRIIINDDNLLESREMIYAAGNAKIIVMQVDMTASFKLCIETWRRSSS
ncbi:hypothetical protein D3C87_1914590 [compost metagenome]